MQSDVNKIVADLLMLASARVIVQLTTSSFAALGGWIGVNTDKTEIFPNEMMAEVNVHLPESMYSRFWPPTQPLRFAAPSST